jgi:hypothetical protein
LTLGISVPKIRRLRLGRRQPIPPPFRIILFRAAPKGGPVLL